METTDYEKIKATVDAKLVEMGVNYSVIYCGETKRDDWTCDAWRVSFARVGTQIDTEYFTGTGHRKQVNQMPVPPYRKGTLAYQQWVKDAFRPVEPRAADVLHSLLLDSSAIDSSFNDWCADYGYDNDSMKAFDTYQKCCAIGEKLRKIFTSDQLAALSETLQDF